MNSIDKSKIKPIPIQKTATLVNNILVTTISFLNSFSDTVEAKLSTVSNKVTELEILLTVLEEKLNSVPSIATDLSLPNDKENIAAPGKPTQTEDSIRPIESSSVTDNCVPAQSSNSLLDSEDYIPFVKMIKVGVPKFVVINKAVAAGLDGSVLEAYEP